MIRKLRRVFRRKTIWANQNRDLRRGTPGNDQLPDDESDAFKSEHVTTSMREAVFNIDQPPPATRWSAPPYDHTAPGRSQTPLYRDECIKLHREVAKLETHIDHLIKMNQHLSADYEKAVHDRDHAIQLHNVHWEDLQRTEYELGQIRAENDRLRARMDALERHRWRRAMCARVEDAENRARAAEEELKQWQQLSERMSEDNHDEETSRRR
ncbi:hypothetical protein M409DRAFT_26722 [Zasmidium cellare ATCC 36951]|uniref:Autophagy-related protein 16 domain-containing protein n=1 Tax=Zasmidium cellare ATCC 36951 TaxID=1080233 RepID=A0A6A6C6R0_ZASCE|nr:uncharacterized protein M409DRAFT_26722 [Zasmidium cellare ATCC 36951]KAF2162867.1 hypothetical protein M409DRAFT_26722 [Zasmidium cellare ATCC 36951]